MENNPNNRIEKHEARTLRLHPTAKRALVRAKAKKITNELDLDAIGTLHAVDVEVNGERALYLVDGYHRLTALLDRGMGEWLVDVMIHKDVTTGAQASALFRKLNYRSGLDAITDFDQAVLAGEPAEVAITLIGERHGFKIGKGASEKVLCCPASLRQVFAADHGNSLDKTLAVATTAWGHTPGAVEGKLLEGIGRVFAANNGSIEQSVLVEKLAKYPGGAAGVLGSAKSLKALRSHSLSRCIADVVIEVYNKGRPKNRLSLP